MTPRAFTVVTLLLFLPAACVTGPAPAAEGRRTFEACLAQGREFLSHKLYGQAAAEFQAAIAIKPDSAVAHNGLGLCCLRQQDYDAAAELFEKSVALDPAYAEAYSNLGGAYSLRLQFAQAEEAYRKALSLSPALAAPNYWLGILLTNLGRNEEGAALITRGYALDPGFLQNNRETLASYDSLAYDMREAYFVLAAACASAGNVEQTLGYLSRAKAAGFTDWERIKKDKDFVKVRNDPRIRKFISGL